MKDWLIMMLGLTVTLAEWVSEEEVLDKARQHVYEDHVITSKEMTLEMKENIGEKTCNATVPIILDSPSRGLIGSDALSG